MDLQIGSWNNSIKGIDDYAWFITSKKKAFLNSKSKENSETPKQILSLWKNGQLDQLMFEGKTNQYVQQYNDRVTTNNNKEALTFARLIEAGKVNKAIKILET